MHQNWISMVWFLQYVREEDLQGGREAGGTQRKAEMVIGT